MPKAKTKRMTTTIRLGKSMVEMLNVIAWASGKSPSEIGEELFGETVRIRHDAIPEIVRNNYPGRRPRRFAKLAMN